MDREQQILKEIEEKENLIKKTKDEIFSLNFELHKIEKEKVLKKFKIGDIIVERDKYIFKLDEVVNDGAKTSKLVIGNMAYHYKGCMTLACSLDTLLEFCRLANNEEIERFNVAD